MAITHAIKVLVDFAANNVEKCEDPDERIKVYQALSETLPTSVARQTARNLAEADSRRAALQLEFRSLISR